MFYIRFRDGSKRYKIFGEKRWSCRRRTNAKLFPTYEQAKEFSKLFGPEARISGPVDPVTRKALA